MMKRIALLVLVAATLLPGCRSTGSSRSGIADWIMPGTSDSDDFRRFWDQTSDNPYR